jgi:hypothetical protein
MRHCRVVVATASSPASVIRRRTFSETSKLHAGTSAVDGAFPARRRHRRRPTESVGHHYYNVTTHAAAVCLQHRESGHRPNIARLVMRNGPCRRALADEGRRSVGSAASIFLVLRGRCLCYARAVRAPAAGRRIRASSGQDLDMETYVEVCRSTASHQDAMTAKCRRVRRVKRWDGSRRMHSSTFIAAAVAVFIVEAGICLTGILLNLRLQWH